MPSYSQCVLLLHIFVLKILNNEIKVIEIDLITQIKEIESNQIHL